MYIDSIYVLLLMQSGPDLRECRQAEISYKTHQLYIRFVSITPLNYILIWETHRTVTGYGTIMDYLEKVELVDKHNLFVNICDISYFSKKKNPS